MKYLSKSNTMKANTLVVISAVVLTAGCYSSGNNPGIEYAPNMYISEAYEPYSQTEEMQYNQYGMTMRMPVKGTIAQGQMDFTNYPEGYEASVAWVNPLQPTEVNVAEGQRLYDINCQHCHGKGGKNDGGVIKSGQYAPPPWPGYSDAYIKELSDGKIFHTITYGKNNMGPHKFLLTPTERWKVLMYVRKLSLGDAYVYAKAAENTSAAQNSDANTSLSVQPKWLTGVTYAEVSQADLTMVSAAMKNVQFDNVRYKTIRENSKSYVDQVAKYMIAHPDLKAVIVGHLSSDAEMDKIQDGLSEIRAKAVMDLLVSKGIAANRLSARGMGATQPIASNDTKEGREVNRRVEIYFVK